MQPADPSHLPAELGLFWLLFVEMLLGWVFRALHFYF